MVELSFFPFVVLSFVTSIKCLGVVGVAVEGSMLCCDLFPMQETLPAVKGNKTKLQGNKVYFGHANKNFNFWVLMM